MSQHWWCVTLQSIQPLLYAIYEEAKQEWAKGASLLHSDAAEESGREPFLWMVQAGLILTVHGAQALQYPPTDAKSLQHLPQHVPWYCIKGFFEVHKTNV